MGVGASLRSLHAEHLNLDAEHLNLGGENLNLGGMPRAGSRLC